MSQQTPIVPDNQEPIIPPGYLLAISALGFLAALAVLFTQPQFNAVGYGGLALGVLALLAWLLMSPAQARETLGGRTARFGGLSLLVTLLVVVMLVAVYVGVRTLDLSADLSQGDDFSLTETAADAITRLGADPTLPEIRILAFYGAAQAGRRDRDTVLLDDYVSTSSSKISYAFIDPDRSPQIAEQYGVTRDGQLVVTTLDGAGEPLVEEAELVNVFSQDDITNAILKVSAQGDFRVYVLDVEGGLSTEPSADQPSMSSMVESLESQFDWTITAVAPFELANPASEIVLNDPNADGEVLVIPGGTRPLTDDELQIVRDYVAAGGDLVVYAANSLNAEGEALATADNFAAWLDEATGIRINNDVVIDQTQAFQSPLIPVVTDFDTTAFITTNIPPAVQPAAIMEVPHSLTLSDTPPADVVVTPLMQTSDQAYARTDFAAVLEGNVEPAEGDAAGPFVVGAQAENAATGSRVVVFGSVSPIGDEFAAIGNLANTALAFNSMVWTTRFDEFFVATNIISEQTPQDTPLFASAEQVRTVNFFTLFLLPFGMLAVGIFVWWSNRERDRAR